ncbi:MAG: 2-C-methyl-D-erythritol 4-phosphate cytidylyltransferase [Steroidobacteraceae bacterium]|nr:2-C-methyl-D-erythritol 4-phosphate cytidylyltransferase [Steroidobacteraceae bacterium]
MRYALVVPAAGSGRRFGASVLRKQYEPLAGATVIEHALTPFLFDARCHRIVVAIATDDAAWPQVAARCEALGTCPVGAVAGGAERADSVRRALAAVHESAEADEWVLVHDAARPCVSRAEIDALIAAVLPHPVGGLLAVPVADTLKRAVAGGHDPQVERTEAREGLWRALTPQMFRLGPLMQALAVAQDAGRSPTDEAQAMEWEGHAPLLVTGDARNIKVTTPADLALAEALLQGSPAATRRPS